MFLYDKDRDSLHHCLLSGYRSFPGTTRSRCIEHFCSPVSPTMDNGCVYKKDCGLNLSSACVWMSCPKCINMKHYCFHLGWSPPILKQRTEANISSMLSAPASPAMMRGRLLKNDFSCACHRLVPCYLFSQWITKWTFSHLPSVHYLVLWIIILIWKNAITMITR